MHNSDQHLSAFGKRNNLPLAAGRSRACAAAMTQLRAKATVYHIRLPKALTKGQ